MEQVRHTDLYVVCTPANRSCIVGSSETYGDHRPPHTATNDAGDDDPREGILHTSGAIRDEIDEEAGMVE